MDQAIYQNWLYAVPYEPIHKNEKEFFLNEEKTEIVPDKIDGREPKSLIFRSATNNGIDLELYAWNVYASQNLNILQETEITSPGKISEKLLCRLQKERPYTLFFKNPNSTPDNKRHPYYAFQEEAPISAIPQEGKLPENLLEDIKNFEAENFKKRIFGSADEINSNKPVRLVDYFKKSSREDQNKIFKIFPNLKNFNNLFEKLKCPP